MKTLWKRAVAISMGIASMFLGVFLMVPAFFWGDIPLVITGTGMVLLGVFFVSTTVA